MQVKTVTYTEVFGMYVLGFKKMDTHMSEMANDGWRVQAQIVQPPRTTFFSKKPGAMIVTYVKD